MLEVLGRRNAERPVVLDERHGFDSEIETALHLGCVARGLQRERANAPERRQRLAGQRFADSIELEGSESGGLHGGCPAGKGNHSL